jgi:hypothetical protein
MRSCWLSSNSMVLLLCGVLLLFCFVLSLSLSSLCVSPLSFLLLLLLLLLSLSLSLSLSPWCIEVAYGDERHCLPSLVIANWIDYAAEDFDLPEGSSVPSLSEEFEDLGMSFFFPFLFLCCVFRFSLSLSLSFCIHSCAPRFTSCLTTIRAPVYTISTTTTPIQAAVL